MKKSLTLLFLLFTISCSPYWTNKLRRMGNSRYDPAKRVVAFDINDDFEFIWSNMISNCNGGWPRIVSEEKLIIGDTTKVWLYYSCER